ncbi:MAG: alginate export family protein, partial [Candidatus Omnitrophica bacterium]|nr:alginate export family protein [Candidatus Omnitrophota bacterium]
ELNTLGAFTKCNFSPYTIRKQAAVQFGNYGENDRFTYGGYGFLDRDFKDAKFSPKLSAGILYLSGDKKSSARNEGWDPLFSRWPWMSELYALTMAGETGVLGYWTNMQIYRLELTLNTTKKTKLILGYNYLRANAQVAASTIFSGTGKERGHLPQVRLDYKVSDNITTCFLGEYLKPGNFYEDNDPGIFLRTEVQIKF